MNCVTNVMEKIRKMELSSQAKDSSSPVGDVLGSSVVVPSNSTKKRKREAKSTEGESASKDDEDVKSSNMLNASLLSAYENSNSKSLAGTATTASSHDGSTKVRHFNLWKH
jgi:hypothetical protein